MMFRNLRWLFASLVLVLAESGSNAQSPTPTDPPGTIVNGQGDSAGKIKSWISRHGDSATALTLYSLGDDKIYGTLRRFKVDVEGSPALLKDPILVDPDDNGPIQPTLVDVVAIKLEPVSTGALYESWEIVYDPRAGFPAINNPPTKLILGWVAFQPGKEDRSGSTVVVRMKKGTVANAADPCSGPPADDVGEEELISGSLTYANTPVSPLPPYSRTANDSGDAP